MRLSGWRRCGPTRTGPYLNRLLTGGMLAALALVLALAAGAEPVGAEHCDTEGEPEILLADADVLSSYELTPESSAPLEPQTFRDLAPGADRSLVTTLCAYARSWVDDAGNRFKGIVYDVRSEANVSVLQQGTVEYLQKRDHYPFTVTGIAGAQGLVVPAENSETGEAGELAMVFCLAVAICSTSRC